MICMFDESISILGAYMIGMFDESISILGSLYDWHV